MRFDVLTLFPDMFGPVLSESILKLAQARGLIDVHLHNIRDYSADKHHKVDDRPYGGGPGMVMKPDCVFAAVEAVEAMDQRPALRVLLTPKGERLDQQAAKRFASHDRLLLICGRYEGFDERIRLGLRPLEVSIGDYVLTGGELPAMVVIDTVSRLVPGVLGHPRSAAQDSFESGLLDCPQYTRPVEFLGMRVPDVLLSGNHAEIERWRSEQAQRRTAASRADLLAQPQAPGQPTSRPIAAARQDARRPPDAIDDPSR